MSIFGMAVFPLVERVKNDGIKERWHAVDGSVAGKLEDLRNLLDIAILHGKHFGLNVEFL